MKVREQKTTRQVFMTKTLTWHAHMRKRFKPRPLPFTVGQLRDWLLPAINSGAMRCEYCKKPLSIKTVTLDHRVPVSAAGSLHLINLALCCSVCNQTKADLTGEEYLFLMSGIRTMSERAQKSILSRLRTRPAMIQQLRMQQFRKTSPANHNAAPTSKGQQPNGKERLSSSGRGAAEDRTLF